jgi:ABC-2 type transport system ATP-binding protein
MAITVEGLDVRYKDKHAVKGVSFHVEKGEIFGMIGANGAGKTTIIECIEGLRTKYKGAISVLGIDPKHNRTELYKRIGVQLQETTYQDKVKVAEIGKLFASFYPNAADFDSLLEEFDLTEKKKSYIGKLSGGQRQRLSIILALMANPEVVFLDEITTGLDPKSRRDIWEKIKSLKNRGITVYMTTHFMEEAEYLCDRVAIVRKGEIVALDTLSNLIENADVPDLITFECDRDLNPDIIGGWSETISCKKDGNKYYVEGDAESILPMLYNLVEKNGVMVQHIDVKHPNMEDIFFKYAGESLMDSVTDKTSKQRSGKKVK